MATNHQKQMITTPSIKRSYIRLADKDEAIQRRKERMIETSKNRYAERGDELKDKIRLTYYSKKYGEDNINKYLMLFDFDLVLALIKLKFAFKNKLENNNVSYI